MFDYTFQNHLKFGFNENQWFNNRTSPEDQWHVVYGKATRPIASFHDECLATARMIRDIYTGPIWVFLSGGMDSEIVVRSFIEARIPIRVAITRFKYDLNIHDISYAVILCEEYGVPYRFIDLDVEKFCEDTLFEYAALSQSASLAISSLNWATDQIDGLPVIGSGECFLRQQENFTYAMSERETVHAIDRHFILRNREGVPGFFQYTPELMLSWLQHPMISTFIKLDATYSTLNYKNDVYIQEFIGVHPRVKYTGFEKLYNERFIADNKLGQLYGQEVVWSEYYSLIESLKA